jgi:hypothetical protein
MVDKIIDQPGQTVDGDQLYVDRYAITGHPGNQIKIINDDCVRGLKVVAKTIVFASNRCKRSPKPFDPNIENIADLPLPMRIIHRSGPHKSQVEKVSDTRRGFRVVLDIE